MGQLGALLSNQFGAAMGVTANYSPRSGTQIALVGFVGGGPVTKDYVLKTLSEGNAIPFFFGAQTDASGGVFPPTDGISLFDEVIWTPSVTDTAISLVIESFEDVASMGQMFRLKCYIPKARQLGQVG